MQSIQKIDSTIIHFIDKPNIKNYVNFYTNLITANDNSFINLSEIMSLFNTIEFIKQYKNHRIVGCTKIPEEIIYEIDELKNLVLYTFLTVSFFRNNVTNAGLQHTINSMCVNKTPAEKFSDIRWFLLGEIFKSSNNFHQLKIPQHWMLSQTSKIILSPSYCYSQAVLRNPYLIPAWQRLHDIFSATSPASTHYFPNFAPNGFVKIIDFPEIQRVCSQNIKNIDPMASTSHYQSKTNPIRLSQPPAIVNNNTSLVTSSINSTSQCQPFLEGIFRFPAKTTPSAPINVQPIEVPQAISDFITKITTMNPSQKTKEFVDQLKGDFQNLKLAIRNVQDLVYISQNMPRKDILYSFLSHFITHPSYVNKFRQDGKSCDSDFLKQILGNNTHDVSKNLNIIVELLPKGGDTLKPQQSLRKRLDKEVSNWKFNQFRKPTPNVLTPVAIPLQNQPVAAIIIEQVHPMEIEAEGGEYEDEPVIQRSFVNIQTHQDNDLEVDAPPLPTIDSLSSSGDSLDNDDKWVQSIPFQFFATAKIKTRNGEDINLSLSSSTEYDEKTRKNYVINEVTFDQESEMDIESKNTKRNRDTSNDVSEAPNKRPKM
jgi:hypothetical protein